MRRNHFLRFLLSNLIFTVLGFLVMGYHPGIEDDGVYLTAVKADLHPGMFTHDADFFRVQLQATVFDGCMADFVHITHIPLAWSEFLWQFWSLFLILCSCHAIAAQLFPKEREQWGAVAMVSAMFSLPVAGTRLYLADQHLHPRAVATALLLLAVSRILAGKHLQALLLLVLAMLFHPIMGALGISFCLFVALCELRPKGIRLRNAVGTISSFMPLGWIFDSPSPQWQQALETREYYFLTRWEWYEWLGALAPTFLFWLLWRYASKRGENKLARFSLAIVFYAIFQQIVAWIMLGTPALARMRPLQPMRFLHLIYIFLCLTAGALLARYMLKSKPLLWIGFLLLANGGMLYAQLQLFSNSEHLEMPWVVSRNNWIKAFTWIRDNTPHDAYFALDPNYMTSPGEDYHSFRALAERSAVSDIAKDSAVVTQVPSLAATWSEQQHALAGWQRFRLSDFEQLKSQFKVGWVVVNSRQALGLTCQWHNQDLEVCQIP